MTRTALRTTFLSLRVRNFRLFFTGQLISQVGTWLTSIALVLLVLHRTGSGIAIGLLTAAQFGPILILGAWAGLVADRSNKRTLLLVTQSLEMVQSFALAALAFWPGAPLWSFYAVAFAGGIMMAFDNPTRRAFVSEMVPEANVQNAVSLNAALMTSSRIIGPALAGLLSVTVGFGWCFTVDGLSYLAVLASLWMMRTAELRTPPVADRARGQVREGFRYVRRTPDLWIPLVMLAVIGTFTFNFAVVLPLLIERSLGGTDGTYTAIYSVLSVGSLLGALAAAQRRQVQIRTMCRRCGGVRRGDAAVRLDAGRVVRLPVGAARRVRERVVRHRVDSDDAVAIGPPHARACPRATGDRPDRQHARRAVRCWATSAICTERGRASSSAGSPRSGPPCGEPWPLGACIARPRPRRAPPARQRRSRPHVKTRRSDPLLRLLPSPRRLPPLLRQP